MDCFMDVFMCRKCRSKIFEGKDLLQNHLTSQKCSLWFLQSDEMLPWVFQAINEAQWTKGKLYCPHCKARIGSFDFINLIPCECGSETIPAIYCVKSKLDHKKSKIPVVDSIASNIFLLESMDNTNKGLSLEKSLDNSFDYYDIHLDTDIVKPNCLDVEIQSQENDKQVSMLLNLKDDSIYNQHQHLEQLELMDMTLNRQVSFKTSNKFFPCNEGDEYETSLVELLSFEHEQFDLSCICNTYQSSKSRKKQLGEQFNASQGCISSHVFKCVSCQSSHNVSIKKVKSKSASHLCCKCQSVKFNNSHSTKRFNHKRQKSKKKLQPMEEEFVNISYSAPLANDSSLLVCSNCLFLLGDPPTQINKKELSNLHNCIDGDGFSQSEAGVKTRFEKANEANDKKKNELEILEEHQCPICWDLFYDPYKTVCSHIFCSPCLRQLNKSSQQKPLCPLCRRRVYTVTACEDLQSNLKDLYPDAYMKRSKVERRKAINQFPLPSSGNVFFEADAASNASRITHYFYVIRTLLIVLFMLVLYLLNGDYRQEHRRFARHLRYAFYFVCFFAMLGTVALVGLLFTLNTYTCAKFIFGFVTLYLTLTKLLLRFLV